MPVPSVIGLGLGRTGTNSVQKAQEILYLGPCHHGFCILPTVPMLLDPFAEVVGFS